MILITLLSIVAVVASQSNIRPSCSQLEKEIREKCPGSVRSEYGLVSTSRDQVKQMMSERVKEVVDDILQRNAASGNQMLKMATQLLKLQNSTEYLPMMYNGKRYWIEFPTSGLNCYQAKEVCAANGGTPANIYSREHYNVIMDKLRILARAGGIMAAFTGMTYNEKTKTVSLSDGSPAPFVLWSLRPANSSGCVHLYVVLEGSDPGQNMASLEPSHPRVAVVCEK